MQWFDSIYDLQYYHQAEGVPCYCEALIRPSDMILQGMVSTVAANSYTLQIDVYSADGITKYETATTYFNYFFAATPDGRKYFNARLKGYSPAMCAHECYVLNVIVKNSGGGQVFNRWTERYCIAECCDEVTGITFEQDGVGAPHGFQPPWVIGTGPVLTGGPLTPTIGGPTPPPGNSCGEPYVTITSYFDCNDKFTGDYYGDAGTVYSGTAFKYKKITNLKGLIRRLPREIKREYSLNCKLQRVESTTQYQLIGFDAFAGWKMRELEDQLHASHIAVNNYTGIKGEVQYSGGAPFALLKVGYSCTPYYKLDATLNDCTVNQIFGCGDKCSVSGSAPLGFVVPAAQGMKTYYDENKKLIGTTPDELANYYRTRPGVSNVEVLDSGDYDCDFETAFVVHSTGYVPTYFYVNDTRAGNRIYSQSPESLAELCTQIKPACATPQIGIGYVEDAVCDTAVIGIAIIESYPKETLLLTGYGNWVLDVVDSEATRSQNTVVLNITVSNTEYTYNNADPDATIPLIGAEVIAYVGQPGWPLQMKTFTHADNSSIPNGGMLMIYPDGKIVFAGEVTTADLTGSIIELTNIIYTL